MSAIRFRRTGRVARITLDNPPVNSITVALLDEIAEAMETIRRDEGIACAVLDAAGKVFCAGMDLREAVEATRDEAPARLKKVRETFAALRRCPVPLIGAVQGPAMGAGMMLVTVCDFAIASEAARFGMPEIDRGRMGGGSYLGRVMPQGLLRRMLFTGRPVSATEACAAGVVAQVTAAAALAGTVDELAETIVAKDGQALRYQKMSLVEAETLSVDEGFAHEQTYAERLLLSGGSVEEMKKFLETGSQTARSSSETEARAR